MEICHNDFILVVHGNKVWAFREMQKRRRETEGEGQREEEWRVNHRQRRNIYFLPVLGNSILK